MINLNGLGIEGDIEVMNQEMYPDTLDEPVLETFVFLCGSPYPKEARRTYHIIKAPNRLFCKYRKARSSERYGGMYYQFAPIRTS